MSSYRPCAVPGCEDRKSTRHRFPNPEKDYTRYVEWIRVVSNSKLNNLDHKSVYKSYRVCHQHFTIDDKSTNMYLKRTAVPSQQLPFDNFILCETSKIQSHQENLPSSSVPSLCMTPPPSKKQNDNLLRSVGVSRSCELTPKAKELYKRAKISKCSAGVYRQRYKSIKKRIALGLQVHSFSALRSEAINFCIQQLTRKPSKPRGRRFSLEEKIMALALYKTSGPGYRFLSKWFTLPSRRTLMRLLNNISLGTVKRISLVRCCLEFPCCFAFSIKCTKSVTPLLVQCKSPPNKTQIKQNKRFLISQPQIQRYLEQIFALNLPFTATRR
ncbi:hypothetical protein RN001_001681 [Aquatica leii]|uniref:THAP-type domain-containing protein n=1 Tax=Aquatica leii TaxID=1421715 RepID=A0AAN7QAK5_9COLE|nr:hypothetical protein RN001_001681 [Aquatica leii]